MTLSIGALATAAGVSVQTLRHYDQLGLLRPSQRTKAGYRMYSADDRAKLDVIRTLRELDFDLASIGQLLRGKTSLAEGAALQLRALEHQQRIIRRRVSVLRVFLAKEITTLTPHRLQQLQTLARLERAEQAGFLAGELARRMERRAPEPMRRALTGLATIELPESPTEDQLDAWLELAELVADPAFLAHYPARIPSGHSNRTDADWRERNEGMFAEAVAARKRGINPASRSAAAIARRWVQTVARQAGRRDYKRFAHEMVDAVDSGRHAPERRFWDLMAVLRPEIARSPQMIARDWLVAATRHWLAR